MSQAYGKRLLEVWVDRGLNRYLQDDGSSLAAALAGGSNGVNASFHTSTEDSRG